MAAPLSLMTDLDLTEVIPPSEAPSRDRGAAATMFQ